MKISNILSLYTYPKINQQKSKPFISPSFGALGGEDVYTPSCAESDRKNLNKPIYDPLQSCEQICQITDDFLLSRLSGRKINSLCDLGCGYGGPTMILAGKLEIPPKNVVGVDTPYFETHHDFGEGKFESGNMISYLHETDKSFDMISLCRPDCLYWGVLANELLDSVADRLTDDGYFFTYGENPAMDKVIKVCEEKGIKYKSKKYAFDNMRYADTDKGHNLQAVLIPKSELLKGFS